MSDILFFLCAIGIFYVVLEIIGFVWNKVASPRKENKPVESQYTDDEIRMAQYLEAKARSDTRYQVFRQMMHDTARKDDR
ncbi:hypothetical protein [Enterococcus caccae]|uniref:Uncharacterized protein n=1 Tax=Enterococcus caccae ATCC BAA-1240 TaxID=1158612 RepID=R3TQ16_9ENTE|nr:hypothetical protein [Enterococcus caccae]EOL43629.1 hypothetical protein UC7_02959 [Enterococcus caccae ATCC BAA-1240]EOT67971.1 hypothetical protein I580_00353 [Enterococcus caccae ATCC BAA-1240]OJG28539.1 hypothetical protein RU98_GL000132 [Enterococcus caccae]